MSRNLQLSLLASLVLAGACVPAARSIDPTPVAPHLRDPVAGSRAVEPTGAPLPDPLQGNRVELASLFAYADANSPILLVARSTRSRAEAERVAARIALPSNPELSIAIGPRVANTGIGLSAQIALSQELEIAGERGLRIDAANRRIELTDAEIERVRWAVHCDVHVAFHAALLARDRAALAGRVVSFQTEVLAIVERRVSAGEVGALELRLSQAEVAQAGQAQVAADQAYYAARVHLAQLTGWPVGDPPDPIGRLEDPIEPPPVEELLATAREQLPAIQVDRAAIREAEARAKVAKREASPNPTIGIQYEREGNPAGDVTYDIVRGSLSIPIPSAFVNQGARARARADVTVAEAQLQADYTLLESHVTQARAAVVAAAERVHRYGTQIIPLFEENLTLLGRSFDIGEIDLLALSFARERFLAIQNEALDAQLEYFVALAELERTIGSELWVDVHAVDSP
jgi:cobalt-zinc-cadmium efflux system outer membrane protein